MIVRRTGERDRGRVSVRPARRPLSFDTLSCTAPATLRTRGDPLPDPGGGFRDSTNRPNPAPRPALRARRFRVPDRDRGRYRAVKAQNRRLEAAGTAKRTVISVSWVGVQEAGGGIFRFGFVRDSSYYRLLSITNPHFPAPGAGPRPSGPMATRP